MGQRPCNMSGLRYWRRAITTNLGQLVRNFPRAIATSYRACSASHQPPPIDLPPNLETNSKPQGLKIMVHAASSMACGFSAAPAQPSPFQNHPPTHAIFITGLVASCFFLLAA